MKKKLTKRQIAKQITALQNQLDDIRDAERAKEYKAVIGRCFVYDNGYSHARRWPLFTRVIGVNENGWLVVIRTQIDCEGKLEMEEATLTGTATLGAEISFGKYCAALNEGRAKLEELTGKALAVEVP